MSDDLLLIIFGCAIAWAVLLVGACLVTFAIQHPCIAAIFILSCVAAYFRMKPRNDRGGL